MKKLASLLFCAVALNCFGQPYGVQIDTNSTILRGTNFFLANTNRWYPLLPPGIPGTNGANGNAWVPLFTWTSPSNFVDFSNAMQFYATTSNVAFFGPSNQPANPTVASVEMLLTNISASAITVSTLGFQPIGAATTNFASVPSGSSFMSLFTSEGNGTLTFMNSIPPGMMGAPGTNATFTLTNTVIGPNGSNPSVTNLGTSVAAVLQFTLPASGTNGLNGLNGTNGTNGLNGASGVVLGSSTSGSNGAAATWMLGLDGSGLLTTNAVPSGGGGGGGGGGGIGIDIPLAVVAPADGNNFTLDFSKPAQVWEATNITVHGSTNWPGSVNTNRHVAIFIPPTNYTRTFTVADESTNWWITGIFNRATILPNQSASINANIFGLGETNVSLEYVTGTYLLASTSFSPSSVPGLILWLNASSGCFTNISMTAPVINASDPVRAWHDLSGNGSDCTNATTAPPVWNQFGAPNGYSSVTFTPNGQAALISANSNILSQPLYWFFVWSPLSMTVYGSLFDWKYNNPGVCLCAWSGPMSVYLNENGLNGGNNQGPLFNLPGGWSLLELYVNGSSFQFFTNSLASISPTTETHPNTMQGFTIGGNGGLNNGLYGNIAEVLVYSASLSTNQVSAINAYLRAKYSLW